MKINRLLAPGIILLGLLHSNLALSATSPSAANGIDHVWFGAFINTLPDGKISHDVTALILEQDGSKLSGSVGPSIDRLAPIVDGNVSGNKISFRMESGGSIAFARIARRLSTL